MPSLVMRLPAVWALDDGVLGWRQLAPVEAQLGQSHDLVYILPARPRGADEADLDVVLVDDKVAGYPQHDGTGIPHARNHRACTGAS